MAKQMLKLSCALGVNVQKEGKKGKEMRMRKRPSGKLQKVILAGKKHQLRTLGKLE